MKSYECVTSVYKQNKLHKPGQTVTLNDADAQAQLAAGAVKAPSNRDVKAKDSQGDGESAGKGSKQQ